MKIFSFIFAFYILYLTIAPGLESMSFISSQKIENCCSDTCEPVEKKQPENQSDKKENTDKGVCNPFELCNGCIGFSAHFAFGAYTPVILFAKPYADNNEKVPPQITLDFWQPPKIV